MVQYRMEESEQPVIEARDLGKTYRIYSSPMWRLVEGVLGGSRHVDVPALSGISFSMTRGEAVGIIGRNGSGKSTLLRILAGIIDQSEGEYRIGGRISSVLDLGAGFIAGFSGMENIYLNGRMMGMSEDEISRKVPQILDFAGLGKYADFAVQTYSSGMLLRLGFAIAQCVDAEVLLVDEVLAVGDTSFQQKCLKRMNEFRQGGTTILLVSHSLSDLGGFCDRVIQLDEGRIRRDGPTETMLKEYIEQMRASDGTAGASLIEAPSPHRERTGDVMITRVEFLSPRVPIDRDSAEEGQPVSSIKTGDPLVVRITYSAQKPVNNPLFRLQFRNATGALVHGTNTYRQGLDLGEIRGEGVFEVRYDSIMLLEDRYYVTVGIYPDEYALALADRAHDVHHMAYTLEIKSDRSQGGGIVSMPHRWERLK